jgi:transcriptional regulator with XRE-family HTH domain
MADYTPNSKEAILRRKILGVKIRHARVKAGLNLKEVGEALATSPQAIAEIELGRRDLSLPQLEVMALLFDVPIVYFLSDLPIEENHKDFRTREAMMLRQRIIGVLLQQSRREAGLSQEDLAQTLGIPASQIISYELGHVEIPLQQLEILAERLKVSLNYFLDQGLMPDEAGGEVVNLDEIAQFSSLPKDVREFLSNPANLLYIKIAMSLSDLSAETLRALAEGLLEITY